MLRARDRDRSGFSTPSTSSPVARRGTPFEGHLSPEKRTPEVVWRGELAREIDDDGHAAIGSRGMATTEKNARAQGGGSPDKGPVHGGKLVARALADRGVSKL